MGENWVFGYGSLMWRPGFDHEERALARLHGWHRALCVYSWVHRGTQERPGLVLGLDRGGSCLGVAFRVPDAAWEDTVAYLRAREQVTRVYEERSLPVRLEDGSGRALRALCYTVDRRHTQYAGALDTAEQARFVLQGEGQSGPNRDYVANTIAHLEEVAIRDRRLDAVARLIAKDS